MTSKKTDDITAEEIKAAQKEGALDKVRENANTQTIDQPEPVIDETPIRHYNMDGTNQVEHLTGLGLEGLEHAIDPKADEPLSEETIGKLLILERNGQNRTDFVKLLVKRLGIKDIRKELPQAGGPDYTNDVSAVSKL